MGYRRGRRQPGATLCLSSPRLVRPVTAPPPFTPSWSPQHQELTAGNMTIDLCIIPWSTARQASARSVTSHGRGPAAWRSAGTGTTATHRRCRHRTTRSRQSRSSATRLLQAAARGGQPGFRSTGGRVPRTRLNPDEPTSSAEKELYINSGCDAQMIPMLIFSLTPVHTNSTLIKHLRYKSASPSAISLSL